MEVLDYHADKQQHRADRVILTALRNSLGCEKEVRNDHSSDVERRGDVDISDSVLFVGAFNLHSELRNNKDKDFHEQTSKTEKDSYQEQGFPPSLLKVIYVHKQNPFDP